MEEFRDVKGYEGLYQVSNKGSVKNLERKALNRNGFRTVKERVLKPSKSGRGYLKVILCANGKIKQRTIHQLVAESFLGHKPCKMKLVINHINFDKLDNRVDNLEIVTSRENTNKKHIKSSSKYTGVCWSKQSKKWIAQIRINGKLKHLGYFTNELEASNAYQKELSTVKKSLES